MNLMSMLLARATPQRRERLAQLRAACSRAYESCADMPQFVSCSVGGKRGLLNVTNGCFVRVMGEDALMLSWQVRGSNDDVSPGHEFLLESEDQLQRFVWAMRAQADSLVMREHTSHYDNWGRAA